MDVITNKLMQGDKFAEKITEFVNWCEEAFIVSAFFTDDKEVITRAAECLYIFSLGYIFFAFGMVLVQAFNGAGDTRTPTIMNFFIFWMLQIPLAYLLAIELSIEAVGVYWAIVISETIFTIVGYFLFKRGRWKSVKV